MPSFHVNAVDRSVTGRRRVEDFIKGHVDDIAGEAKTVPHGGNGRRGSGERK